MAGGRLSEFTDILDTNTAQARTEIAYERAVLKVRFPYHPARIYPILHISQDKFV